MLAVLGAALLITAAVILRSHLTASSSGSGGPRAAGKRPAVACTPELDDVCQALADGGVITKVAPFDLTTAAANAGKVDAWLTYGAAPAIAAFDAGAPSAAEGPFRGRLTAIADAPLAVLTSADVLGPTCPVRTLTWACLATKTAALKVGVGEPSTAEGSARLAPLAAALSPALRFDDVAGTTVQALVDDPNPQAAASDQADLLVLQGTAALSFVVGPSARLARAAATPQGQAKGLVVLAPTPAARITVVLAATLTDSDVRAVVDALARGAAAQALAAAGFSSAAQAPLPTELQAGFLYQVRKKAVR
ncbi:MAG: hypothetical protein JWN46_2084 [Acidimicrobiales bacterium]|nr:hypothetical protein [Acidimicrobiales bacterium]